jgi:hypothetical protein
MTKTFAEWIQDDRNLAKFLRACERHGLFEGVEPREDGQPRWRRTAKSHAPLLDQIVAELLAADERLN